MSRAEPSPRRPGSTRKRVEPTPPKHSVPRTDFAERRAQVRNNPHYSDASSTESDDMPGPSGLNKKKTSGEKINLVESPSQSKEEQSKGMIDLVNEEEQ